MADDEQTEAMSDESLELLDKVRKGKPHYFVMSVKGSNVRSLLIKKKAIQEKDLKDARGDGFQAVHGTVSGSGTELVFQVAMSEGFDKAPAGGKVDKLKKFLGDQTGKQLTPAWNVVPQPIPISPESEADVAGEKSPEPQDQAVKLSEALKKLKPLLDVAMEKQPARKGELLSTVQQISDEIKTGQFEAARTNLVAFGKRLQGLGAGTSTGGDFDRLWPAAKTAWQEASDTIDEQISRMQAALRESELEELMRIAEFGFNGISGNFKVPLMAAIRNVDASSGEARQKQVASALSVVEGFRQHLDQEELIEMCDEEAEEVLGVKTTIRATIGGALDQMRVALQAI